MPRTQKGDVFYQNEAAEKAVHWARGNNFVIGRAKGLACDAKFKMGLPEAIQDCNQAPLPLLTFRARHT